MIQNNFNHQKIIRSGILRDSLNHVAKTWTHHLSLQLATLAVLSASFIMVVSTLAVSDNFHRILTLWGESVQVSVYLNESADSESKDQIQKYLGADSRIHKAQFVTKEKALTSFREQMASYAPDLLADGELLKFIPESFQFSITEQVPASDQLAVLQELAGKIQNLPGVDEVSYGQDWVKAYSSIIHFFGLLGGLIISLVILAGAFVLANAIHTSVASRRDEIEVMELIGATRADIRTPFIIEGMLMAVFASVLALSGSYAIFVAAKDYLYTQISYLQLATHIEFLSFGSVLLIIIGSACLGALSAFFCVFRINDGWAAARRVNG